MCKIAGGLPFATTSPAGCTMTVAPSFFDALRFGPPASSGMVPTIAGPGYVSVADYNSDRLRYRSSIDLVNFPDADVESRLGEDYDPLLT